MVEFSSGAQAVLRDAGWFPGRRVDTSAWMATLGASGIAAYDAARKFLAEFGGLVVDISGPGIDRAREPFELDPLLCSGEEDRFLEWGEEIWHSLFPIGVFDMGRYFLGIDEEGEIYLVETWIASFGRMPHAMENLISGVRPDVISEG
ncbi:SUKH-3 domain-containing protein [Streptomyces sp. NPDC094038]|uniref:SUKH-3 domain-containing protein n=1 Tax=Streptomyces sp. NPDC094038 TaxID=3366055 RepID=UPI0037F2D765